ncbi:hypothetical protein ABC733_01400 [Mangrovibacter sp. SLW1]
MSRPDCRTLGDLKQSLAAQGESLDTGQFRAFVQFLQQHKLVSGQPWQSLVASSASRLLAAPRMVHVPLWDPVPLLRFLASMRIPGVWAMLWCLWGLSHSVVCGWWRASGTVIWQPSTSLQRYLPC